MSASHSETSPYHWRNDVFCFADENHRLFTVTNCPPIIHPIPTVPDGDPRINLPFASLLRPQISSNKYPELSFVLRKIPVGDPLLFRLGVDPSQVRATRYEGGWALPDDIRQAWMALEKGLIHVSELLMTSSEQSRAGTSARYAIRYHEHWPPPQDHGYHNVHSSAKAAQMSIARSHGAFLVLAARCSLAIALWQFPGPIRGRIPSVSTTQYDRKTTSVVPDWILFLRRENTPSSWIDALCDSVVSDFSLNLRVGTVFDPTDCPWLPIAPVLRAANVPVFVLWRSPIAINECLEEHPYFECFVPPSTADVSLALRSLPGSQPRLVSLCRHGVIQPLPNYTAFDDSVAPFGPYQLPRESRHDFLARRDRYRADQLRQESSLQMTRRLAREEHANSGDPPNRRSRVYLWVKPEAVFPDLNPRWADGDYRYPIPPPAFKSLWLVHPSCLRVYNSFYDEWDLWFPEKWSSLERAESPIPGTRRNRESDLHAEDGAFPGAVTHNVPLMEEPFNLNSGPGDRDIRDMAHPDNFILHSWYGIQLADTRLFTGINYAKWGQDMWHLFGETQERFPADEESRRAMAGWVAAVMDRDWKSRALEFTWDLDVRHPSYVMGSGHLDIREFVTLERVRSTQRIDDPDNGHIWVSMKFHRDAENPTWTLLTTPMGAMLLVRRLSEANTSADAMHTLLCVGIPVRTGRWYVQPPSLQVSNKPTLALRRLRAPWREKGERPTIEDYDAYCLRVLELSNSPHVRAAWLKGGIVWRIMAEVSGKYPHADLCGTHLEELQHGPSGMIEHYQPVSLDGDGRGYYDDGLTRTELDIIVGVVRVYTGRGNQTEDASWWPKHSAWVRSAGYTGMWSAADERWFQRRLKDILDGKERPLNAGEWKAKLKRQKKAGQLAMRVEQRTWEVMYRHFVQDGGPASDDGLCA